MIAFHGKQDVKDFYLARVREHRAADQLSQTAGYWGKGVDGEFCGCGIGCTVHSPDTAAYERELGVPEVLAWLEDGIFEGLPADRAMVWPEEFLASIAVGADLMLVWPRFAVWLLTDATEGVIRYAKTDAVREEIQHVGDLYQGIVAGREVPGGEWNDADDAYDAYATSTSTSAAAAASYAASYAAAASSAAASSAATSIAFAASAAIRGVDALGKENKEAWTRQADMLLQLMAAAPAPKKARPMTPPEVAA